MLNGMIYIPQQVIACLNGVKKVNMNCETKVKYFLGIDGGGTKTEFALVKDGTEDI